MNKRPRAVIAAFQLSLDGYLQGANGEVDWIDSWSDALDLIPEVDAAVIGGGTYPGYEQLWGAIAADPQSASGTLGRDATQGEVEYAHWTQRTPHFVLSTTLNDVSWDNARVMRDLSEVRSLSDEPGAAIYVIGGQRSLRTS